VLLVLLLDGIGDPLRECCRQQRQDAVLLLLLLLLVLMLLLLMLVLLWRTAPAVPAMGGPLRHVHAMISRETPRCCCRSY
jgi:hypothetical protein